MKKVIHRDRLEPDTGGLSGSSDRVFGIVIAGVFVVLALWPLIDGGRIREWALIPAAAFILLALLRPALLGPANRRWLRFGYLLQRVTNPIIMGAIYFLVVTPTGFIMRITCRDPLRLKIDGSVDTYWIERRPPGPSPESMRNQF